MGVPQKFINSLGKSEGAAKPSHFEVRISDNDGRAYQADQLHLKCHQAVLPGVTAATSQYGTGMPEKNNPYRATFEDVAFSFYCTEGLRERTYFDDWMGSIFKNLNHIEHSRKYEAWPIAYRSDYTRYVDIIKLSQTGDATKKYTLHNAFPTILNDTTLDWGDEEILKMEVTMSYDWWTWTNINLPDMKEDDPKTIYYGYSKHQTGISSNEPESFGKPLEDWPEPRSSGPAVSSSDPKSFGLTKDKGNWIKRNIIGTDEF